MKRGTKVRVENRSGTWGSVASKEFHIVVHEPFEPARLNAVLFNYNEARAYDKWLKSKLGVK